VVTAKFDTFQSFKDFILGLGQGNPNRTVPYRFHSMSNNNTVNKIAEVYAGGQITFLYESPTSETILQTDPWLSANPDMQRPASVLVSDIGESIA
jgi:hypothetical protein